VIGAGEVGINVARTLSADGHDVTVVDNNPERCGTIQGELDALVVEGNGASPRLLRELKVGSLDLLAAVTEVDEVNIIAALGARQLGTRTTVARVRDPDFFGGDEAFAHDVLGIDFVIDPDRATASDIADAILLPGAVSVEYFGDGNLALAEMIVTDASPLVGVQLANRERPYPAYIVGISRAGDASLIRPEVVPQVGDHLLVTSPTEHVRAVISHLAGGAREVRNCVIFGGGKIGLRLAELLERTPVRVTLLERSADRARYLAERLPRTTVLHEEGVSREAQESAGVDDAGAFVASAGDDRANLLAALNAKQLGADLSLAVVSREEFTPLVDALGIDAGVSPRLVTAEAILRAVRGTNVEAVHLLLGGAELLELQVDPGSRVDGKTVGESRLIAHTQIAAIVRDGRVLCPGGSDVVRGGDRAVVFNAGRVASDVAAAFKSS